MSKDLDLFGRGSISRTGLSWKALVAGGLVMLLLAGAGAYRWVTLSTPVTQDDALAIFRSEARAADDSVSSARPGKSSKAVPQQKKRSQRSRRVATDPASAPRSAGSRAAAPTDPSTSGARRSDTVQVERRPPKEGVYSWDTEGYEEAGGARRSFPEESQRIITHDEGGWKQHHYFSDQREIWTTFRLTDDGAAISYQRNKVVFGPITNDSHIDFAPPMLVGPRALEVGQRWAGTWDGDTYGSYTGRTFERVVMDIGGVDVEAFGIELNITLKGDQQGEVLARVWVAPKYSMTVREDYVQDVRANVGNYHGEWSMTLKSLKPRR